MKHPRAKYHAVGSENWSINQSWRTGGFSLHISLKSSTNLETLLYDPLLDWKSIQKPEVHLSKVRRKIRGLVNEKEGLPMNIHGQVDVLIQEATSVERLAQMYGGLWFCYIL